MVIGIAGKKQSGKSKAAEIIKRIVDGGRIVSITAYADPLKVEVFDYLWRWPRAYIHEVAHLAIPKFNELIAPLEWSNSDKIEWVNQHKLELRALLQNYATEFRRGQRQDYWVQKMRDNLSFLHPSDREIVVIADVRFPNEAALVQELGGRLIRINRNVDSLVDPHPSEQHLEVPRIIEVDNNGSIDDLAFAIRSILCEFGVEVRWNNQHAAKLVEEFNKEAK